METNFIGVFTWIMVSNDCYLFHSNSRDAFKIKTSFIWIIEVIINRIVWRLNSHFIQKYYIFVKLHSYPHHFNISGSCTIIQPITTLYVRKDHSHRPWHLYTINLTKLWPLQYLAMNQCDQKWLCMCVCEISKILCILCANHTILAYSNWLIRISSAKL